MKVGFIGLGIMGQPMALNLVQGRARAVPAHAAAACRRTLLDAGGTACELGRGRGASTPR